MNINMTERRAKIMVLALAVLACLLLFMVTTTGSADGETHDIGITGVSADPPK